MIEIDEQVVAVKQLNLNGHQGNQEFIVEVLMLSLLRHSNLVTLIGYCTDGDQRLLVYEYMPLGSLENHLFDLDPNQEPLDWHTRLKIAAVRFHRLPHKKAPLHQKNVGLIETIKQGGKILFFSDSTLRSPHGSSLNYHSRNINIKIRRNRSELPKGTAYSGKCFPNGKNMQSISLSVSRHSRSRS
ncbi:hypothetical protein LXL04_032466 [Taraxacum kok-saghyz]